MGFSSGDLVLHSFIISKGDYSDSQILKFNKDRGIESQPVTSIAWCKDEHFLVAHANGNIYLYDRNLTKENAIHEKCTSTFQVFQNQKPKTNPITKISVNSEPINRLISSIKIKI
jgi:WD40 repeat protein